MLQEEATTRMQELVAADQLDLAIVALDVGYPATVVGVEHLEEPVLLAVPPDASDEDRPPLPGGRVRSPRGI